MLVLVKVQKHDLTRGLPRLSYKDDLLCEMCQKGKQVKNSFSTSKTPYQNGVVKRKNKSFSQVRKEKTPMIV